MTALDRQILEPKACTRNLRTRCLACRFLENLDVYLDANVDGSENGDERVRFLRMVTSNWIAGHGDETLSLCTSAQARGL
jgi:hypothetical protein